MRCILEPGQSNLFSPILFQEFSDVVRNPPFRIETPTFMEDFGTIRNLVRRSGQCGFSLHICDMKNVLEKQMLAFGLDFHRLLTLGIFYFLNLF